MQLMELLQHHNVTTVHDTLGITIEEATPQRVTLSLPVTEKVHQYTRILHGGVSVVLAESAASIGAAMNTDLTRYAPVGVEINANHLRSISRGQLIAIATPVHIGAKIMVWAIEITDDRQRKICVARCTLALRPGNAFKLAAGEA
jgi:1,4-dihydroxy-2-naphthoyl-CoA hydrolase